MCVLRRIFDIIMPQEKGIALTKLRDMPQIKGIWRYCLTEQRD